MSDSKVTRDEARAITLTAFEVLRSVTSDAKESYWDQSIPKLLRFIDQVERWQGDAEMLPVVRHRCAQLERIDRCRLEEVSAARRENAKLRTLLSQALSDLDENGCEKGADELRAKLEKTP